MTHIRHQLDTPIALQERQHLVSFMGKYYSVFSYVMNGKRRFKCREQFADSTAATDYWMAVYANA
jgi:hypothetical protein